MTRMMDIDPPPPSGMTFQQHQIRLQEEARQNRLNHARAVQQITTSPDTRMDWVIYYGFDTNSTELVQNVWIRSTTDQLKKVRFTHTTPFNPSIGDYLYINIDCPISMKSHVLTTYDKFNKLDSRCSIFSSNRYIHRRNCKVITHNKSLANKLIGTDIKRFIKRDWSIDLDNSFDMTTLETEYIPNIAHLLTKKHHIIKSQTNTAKTAYVVDLIQRLDPNVGVLSITSRIGLSNDHMKRFESLGFTHYHDLPKPKPKSKRNRRQNNRQQEPPAKEPHRVIICLDSITKLKDLSKYKHVYLDECEPLFKHLFSETMKDRRDVLDTFCKILRAADKIICTDADISDLSVHFLSQFCKKEETDFIINTHKPAVGKTMKMFGSMEELINRMIQSITNGKKVFVGTDSKKIAKELKQKLDQMFPELKERSRLYTSEDGDRAELLDIESVWDTLIYVKCSPVITYGINADFDFFDEVYGFYKGNTISIPEISQQLTRVRKAETLNVWVREGESNICTDYETIKNAVIKMEKAYMKLFPAELTEISFDPRNGFSISEDSFMTQLFIYYQRTINIGKTNPRQRLKEIMELKGFTVEDADPIDQSQVEQHDDETSTVGKRKRDYHEERMKKWEQFDRSKKPDKFNRPPDVPYEQHKFNCDTHERIESLNIIPQRIEHQEVVDVVTDEKKFERHGNMYPSVVDKETVTIISTLKNDVLVMKSKSIYSDIMICHILENVLDVKRLQYMNLFEVPKEKREKLNGVLHKDIYSVLRYRMNDKPNVSKMTTIEKYEYLFENLMGNYKVLFRDVIKYRFKRVDGTNKQIREIDIEKLPIHLELIIRHHKTRKESIMTDIIKLCESEYCRLNNCYYNYRAQTIKDLFR